MPVHSDSILREKDYFFPETLQPKQEKYTAVPGEQCTVQTLPQNILKNDSGLILTKLP